MGTSDTEHLLQRFTVDAWSREDFSGSDESIAEDDVPEPGTSAEQLGDVVRTYRNAFPDLTLTVYDTVTEGTRSPTEGRWREPTRGSTRASHPAGAESPCRV